MKKNFLILLFIFAVLPFVLSGIIEKIILHKPAAGVSSRTSENTGRYTKNNTSKEELDRLAMSILKEAERRNNAGMQPYFQEMMKKGVTAVSSPHVVAKRTPQCPPIEMELNGRRLSGSLCARMCYEYDKETYCVGYCK